MRASVWYPPRQSGAYGARRVVRGGSYWNHARNCRSAYRNENDPGNRNRNQGFRLAAAHLPEDPAADQAPVAPGFVLACVILGRVSVGVWMRVRTLPAEFFPARLMRIPVNGSGFGHKILISFLG